MARAGRHAASLVEVHRTWEPRSGRKGRGVLLLALLACVAACSSERRIVGTPDETSSTSVAAPTSDESVTPISSTAASTAPNPTAPPTTTTPDPAALGSTITLEGADTEMAVTVTAIADPAPPAPFLDPDAGTRLVGVELRLVNVGTTVYRDSPSNGAKVIDVDNQQFTSSVFASAIGPELGSPAIAAGDTRLGWLTFQLPEGAKPERFTLALDSGFGPQTGEWLLTAGSPSDPAPAVTTPAAGPGSTITLEGHDGATIEVTLVAVADPAPPAQFGQPAAGHRFVATQVRLRNVGVAAYSDSPSNGMALIDTKGQKWQTTVFDSEAGPGFAGGSVTLAPNDERVGWVTFETAADVAIAKLTMALNSGFADMMGEWRLA